MENNNDVIIHYITKEIEYHTGGEEMKTISECIRDEFLIEEYLKLIKFIKTL